MLSGILDTRSFCLTDKGDAELVAPHPNFRVFAAMNPPTDVGKRELSASLRSRFTELYIEEMMDPSDLLIVVEELLGDISGAPCEDVVQLYLACRASSEEHLEDSVGLRPRYSLRSLTRAIKAARNLLEIGIKPLTRALYEGFKTSFETPLCESSKRFLDTFIEQFLQVKF